MGSQPPTSTNTPGCSDTDVENWPRNHDTYLVLVGRPTATRLVRKGAVPRASVTNYHGWHTLNITGSHASMHTNRGSRLAMLESKDGNLPLTAMVKLATIRCRGNAEFRNAKQTRGKSLFLAPRGDRRIRKVALIGGVT